MQDKRTEGVALYNFGRLARKSGDLERAESLYKDALPILQSERNLRDEGWTLAFLGQIQHDRGELDTGESFTKTL